MTNNKKLNNTNPPAASLVCDDVESWPNSKTANCISYQLLNSVGSISANVAEGYGRGRPGEFEQFLRYARGSNAETDNWLHKSKKRQLITENRYKEYSFIIDEVNKMIGSFISKLRCQAKRK